MAYFNHAFTKVFLGTGTTRNSGSEGPTNPFSTDGFITTVDVPSVELSKLTAGYYGFFDPNTWKTIDLNNLDGCCPLVLASSSLLGKDQLNQYIGGYKETNKSKMINPRYIQKIYRVDSCTPQQSIVSVGYTPQTAGTTVADDFQSGTTAAECQHSFLCGETYYLRIDIKGSPALRFLNHNAYQTLSAYTGCCADQVAPIVPNYVDPTNVYITWAKALVINNYLKDLVLPVVFDYTQVAWYAPGTTIDPISGLPVTSAQWWDNYASSPQAAAWTDALPNANNAGMRLFGAYVETKFGNCTFQVTDFFEKEPVRIYASLVDYNGDPCVFERLCVYNDCRGIQGMGFGEQVVRDLILSQSYLQNFFASNDFRVREITQGYDILNSVNRNALYTRYFILHSVPRYNNPTGVFDNDRYMLEIITQGVNLDLEDFITEWLKPCGDCVAIETEDCTQCDVEPNVPVIII